MGNTPKLRFDGFTEDWEQRKIGEWGYFYYGHSCPKWSVTEDATTPCIRYGELYTKFGSKIEKVYSYTNIPKESLRFSKGTEVLMPRVGEDPLDYNHCTWLSLANIAIGEMISVYNTEQNPLFTTVMFNATLKHEFAKRVEGGSVTNLYYEKLLDIPVSFPNIEEQKKVARLFDNIDRLITLHQRKCNALVSAKKFYLQNLFPQKGETTPRIRFNGFADAWEQRKVGTFTNVLSASRVHKDEWRTEGIPFYRSSDVISAFKGNDNERAFISAKLYEELIKSSGKLEKDDILITGGGNIGIPYIVPNNEPLYSKDADLIWIKKSGEHDSQYLFAYFTSKGFREYISSISHVGTIAHYTIEQVKDTPVLLPSIAEQYAVGTFFARLDHLITLHQRKVSTLQTMKKFMLQNLFPKEA